MNRTARTAGITVQQALVPQVVRLLAKPGDRILDYGAGPTAVHTKTLRKLGFDVDAYDIGKNFKKGLHVYCPEMYSYDIVYASNVVNVQLDDYEMTRLWMTMRRCLKNGRRNLIIFNYPDPRKSGLSSHQMEYAFRDFFCNRTLVECPEYKNVYISRLYH